MADAASPRIFALPEALAARGFRLRAEAPEDRPFLAQIYTSVRWQELEPSGWPVETRHQFLASQFELQYRHYHTYYATADFAILERGGVPVGRLCLFSGSEDLRIVDISLIDEVRNQGAGTALLTAVLQLAVTCGKSVSVHVEQFNPARNLYRRLGFVEAGVSGPYIKMIWAPSI